MRDVWWTGKLRAAKRRRSTCGTSTKEEGHQSARWVFFKCGSVHFQRDCNAHKGTGKQSFGKGKQSKSWFKSESSITGKGKSKENKRKSKGTSKEPTVRTKVPKAYTEVKH